VIRAVELVAIGRCGDHVRLVVEPTLGAKLFALPVELRGVFLLDPGLRRPFGLLQLRRLLLGDPRLLVQVLAIVVRPALLVLDPFVPIVGLLLPAPSPASLVTLRLRDSRQRGRRHECGDDGPDVITSH
jgi:hypothetical protein